MNATISHRRQQWTSRLGAVATVLAAGMLLASLPAMAGAGSPTQLEPRPMPAPAPVAMGDFPEHVRIDAACFAIVTRSSADENVRSERATAITSALFADACLGA